MVDVILLFYNSSELQRYSFSGSVPVSNPLQGRTRLINEKAVLF